MFMKCDFEVLYFTDILFVDVQFKLMNISINEKNDD